MDRIKPRHDPMPATPEEKAEHVGRWAFLTSMRSFLSGKLSWKEIIQTKLNLQLSYQTYEEKCAFMRGWNLERAQLQSPR